MAYIGKEAKKQWITDLICYTPETNTILHINSTLTNFFLKDSGLRVIFQRENDKDLVTK